MKMQEFNRQNDGRGAKGLAPSRGISNLRFWYFGGRQSFGAASEGVPDFVSGLVVMALLLLTVLSATAELTCEGVLGNSGGEGTSLVRYGQPAARGLGVVVDRWGCLWDRIGRGTLARFAPDGRMLARYRLPGEEHHYSDRAVIINDKLVMLLRNKLYVLACEAAPGSEAKPLKQQADALAPTSWQGKALVGDTNGLAWLDLDSGVRTPAGPAFKRLMDLEVGPDGTIFAIAERQVHAIREGKELTDGYPKPAPGGRSQLIEGAWYGHSYHSTIIRFDLALAPAPGVVLGGNSGSFIGHVDESPDIVSGTGLARLESGEWAVGNVEGGICLLSWDDVKHQFTIQRRIGAIPALSGLMLDDKGRINVGKGYWTWDDAPDSPLREGGGGIVMSSFCPAPLGGGAFAAPGLIRGQPVLWAGQVDKCRNVEGSEKGFKFPKDVVGAAAVPEKGGFQVIAVSGTGAAVGFSVTRDGSFRRYLGEVALEVSTKPRSWTSLAVDPKGRLLAAADGFVLEFERTGDNWKEVRRWNSWGEDGTDHFGQEVWIQAEGDRLWVADTERQRVLRFDFKSGKPTASFGETDKTGDDLTHLNLPRQISPNGDRCVVYDAGNQRLLKLKAK